MCCLFGIYNYSGKKNDKINSLVNALANEATERGTDATGISYIKDDKMIIYKKPLPAYKMKFKGLQDAVCVTGHTRHSTQGNKELNYNNHPFMGYCENTKFTLAHNGVLFNDLELRKSLNLPVTKIKTDSYIATQLLEHYHNVNVQNIQKMSESLEGSFCFSIMDMDNTLYLVKGDNPLYIINLPKYNLYVYASTDEILFRALINTEFFDEIKAGNFEEVKLRSEQILTINSKGDLQYNDFKQKRSYYNYGRSVHWWTYNDYTGDWDYIQEDKPEVEAQEDKKTKTKTLDEEYLDELKEIGKYYGYDASDIQYLRDSGYTFDEIEDLFYN